MPTNNILGLDVGEKRVGVALVRAAISIPVVYATLDRQATDFWQQLIAIIDDTDSKELVVGLPRGLDGQETAQTAYVRGFIAELASYTDKAIHLQDEALTSVEAEKILTSTGKPYQKADIDGLAASLILSDFLETGGLV